LAAEAVVQVSLMGLLARLVPSVVRPRRAPFLCVIPNDASRFFLPSSLLQSRRPANVRNFSQDLSGGFSAGGVNFAGKGTGFAAAGFPTGKYLRIFSRRFGPSLRMARKSSALLNAP